MMRVSLFVVPIALATTAAGCGVNRADERGFAYFQDHVVVGSQVLLYDEATEARVAAVGQRLAKVAGPEGTAYRFRVVINPQVQAYATAAGFIYVHTGLLDVVKDRDELAGVLAHEIAHVRESHLMHRIQDAHTTRVVLQIVGGVGGAVGGALIATSIGASAGAGMAQQLVDQGQQLGELTGALVAQVSIEGYARDQELKADRLAIRYMHDAGFDPYGFVRVLKSLKQLNPGSAAIGALHATAMVNQKVSFENREALALEAIAALSKAPDAKPARRRGAP